MDPIRGVLLITVHWNRPSYASFEVNSDHPVYAGSNLLFVFKWDPGKPSLLHNYSDTLYKSKKRGCEELCFQPNK